MNEPWKPLENIWDDYQRNVIKVISQAENTEDMSEEELNKFVWPSTLYVAEKEKEEVNSFVTERTNEILEYVEHYKGLHPKLLSSYILRVLLAGMIWEDERIGK
jgi:hypothetical protein